MNPTDRPSGPAPRHNEIMPAPMAHGHEFELATQDALPSGKKITAKLVARAVRRYWWQAALIWIVGSAGLMTLAFFKVKPMFASFTRVKVEPFGQRLFTSGGEGDFNVYKETQVNIILSPTVIEDAFVAQPQLLTLERVRGSEDPQAEIRSALNVGIVKNTNLIQIETACESPHEAAFIVNAVVDAYLKRQRQQRRGRQAQARSAQRSQAQKEDQVKKRRDIIKELHDKFGMADVKDLQNRNTVTIEEYARYSENLTAVEIEIEKIEARITQLQAEQPGANPQDDPRVLKRMVSDLFYKDPKVAALAEKQEKADERLAELKRRVRDPSDPSLTKPRKDLKDATAQLNRLWDEMEPNLIEQVRSGAGRGLLPDNPLREAETKLAELRAQQSKLTDKLNQVKVKQKDEGKNALALQFEQIDLQRDQSYLDQIDRSLADLEFENRYPDRADPQGVRRQAVGPGHEQPAQNDGHRAGGDALRGPGPDGAPGAARRASGRPRRADVAGAGPRRRHRSAAAEGPAPGALFSARDEFRAQRQLDQFVQSLDHLRVALCSARDAWGRERRCILITSACGSEGKTTLAAQLAERCVNAGLRTLLIDGDLRNPTLTRMLDVPDHRGLINVLRGEVLPDEAISVVGGGGGFHFMPSGTPKVDPSRLLHGDRLGKMLAQARESFDIVIVDAPPVLPVPDALTIGRWCDGAVLAVRCDASRFALVEKANRRLASVGVSVIGAVVNGVRIAESTYGSYYPSYAYTDDRSAPLDI